MSTAMGAASLKKETVDLDVGGVTIPVNLPHKMVRIVGFTV